MSTDYFSFMLGEIVRVLTGRASHTAITRHEVLGIPVVVENTRPDIDTRDVIHRLQRSLSLIEHYVPHHFRHLRRDFAYIVVKRFACRGAYFHEQRACLVELTFTVNPSFSDAEVAATILHEAMHARLHRLGFPLEMEDRARQERFCRRAEIEFGLRAPGGEPVVERARWTSDLSDEEVAPEIDPRLAAQRIAEMDRAALANRT
ncbi:MAG TPA: hypothetical protein VK494_00680 [Gemmatimonadaceae bacterium]|nr:hypothetical protein [Gemmatimonadaceae bacterium]